MREHDPDELAPNEVEEDESIQPKEILSLQNLLYAINIPFTYYTTRPVKMSSGVVAPPRKLLAIILTDDFLKYHSATDVLVMVVQHCVRDRGYDAKTVDMYMDKFLFAKLNPPRNIFKKECLLVLETSYEDEN